MADLCHLTTFRTPEQLEARLFSQSFWRSGTGCGSARSFGSLALTAHSQKMLVGWSHLQAGLRESPLPSLLMWLLAGFSSLLAGGQKPPSVPCPMGLSTDPPHSSMTEERDWGQAEPQSFYDLILEVTVHHFCSIFS